jgi:hypothetical protein
MVKVTQGKDESLTALAEKHWHQVNPSTMDGNYYVRALISRVIRLHDEHIGAGRYAKAQYYQELLKDEYALLKALIICPAEAMPAMIERMETLHTALQLSTSSANVTDFGYELLHGAFQYSNWRESGSSYLLFDWLGIKVCPYCNWALVLVDRVRNILVVTFDHFYDKGTYPYLSLSFYNLIPACQPCNLTYKNTTPFSLDSHLHPYLDCYNQRNKFNHNYVADANNYSVTIEHDAGDIQSENYNNDLGLFSRYNHDEVKELAEVHYDLSQRYSPDKKNDLVDDWQLVDLHEVEKRICNKHKIPFQEIEILNKQYGKMKRDFAFKSHLISLDNPLIQA